MKVIIRKFTINIGCSEKKGHYIFLSGPFVYFWFGVLLNLMSIESANAWEPKFPEVNEQCPDFTFAKTAYFPDSRKSLKDFEGEYIILDFWGRYCAACINSFHKTNVLQARFRSKVKIILVGNQDKDDVITKLYEKVRVMQNLKLPVAYDSLLFKRFVPLGVPYLVWINKNGTIKAITNDYDLTANNIDRFINDEEFGFTDASFKAISATKPSYDKRKAFLIGGNGGDEKSFIFRSVLAKWREGIPINYPGTITGVKKSFHSNRGLNFLKLPLIELYYYAYFGVANIPYPVYSKPILQLRDSSQFDFSYAEGGKRLYCYSLQVPLDAFEGNRIMQIMKADLQNYFSYTGAIEKKMLPCYVLKIVDQSKIKMLDACGDIKDSNWDVFTGGKFVNAPIQEIAIALGSRLPHGIRILNETGISRNINIIINAILLDPVEIKKALHVYGLDIELTERMMDVLVIKELN